MPRLSSLTALLAAAALVVAGADARAAELVVSAAASLTQAFREIGPLFEAANPGTRLRLNFGASGALLQQIARGAPADVFASADQQTMDQAQAQHLVEAAGRRNFAQNALVLVVPAGQRIPQSLADLRLPEYRRVAIGLPDSVPVGRYTRGALEQAGLWPAVEAKMVGAHNVRQALDYVARGEVDAGFVYASDAALMADKVRLALRVATPTPVLYPIAPVSASAQPRAAQQFVAFVQSPPAQAVLGKYGFGTP